MTCNKSAHETCQECSNNSSTLPVNLDGISRAIGRSLNELPPQFGIRLYVQAGTVRISLDREQRKRRLIASTLANLDTKLQEAIDMAIEETQSPDVDAPLAPSREKRAHVRETAWLMGYEGKPLPANAGVSFIAQYQRGRRTANQEESQQQTV